MVDGLFPLAENKYQRLLVMGEIVGFSLGLLFLNLMKFHSGFCYDFLGLMRSHSGFC